MGTNSVSKSIRSNQSIVVTTSLIILVLSLMIPFSTFNAQAQSQENYVFVQEFAPNEQFSNPDVTIDKQTGTIYVADYFNNRVVKLSSTGNVLTQWGTPGSGDGQFANPQDVAIDSAGFLYVTDTHNHRIQKFDSNGQFIQKWGTPGSGDGQLAFPSRLAFDSNDILYVTEPDNGRIQKFTTAGQFVGKIAEGQLSFPVGIGLDSSNNIYVAESGASGNPSRVDKFNSAGQLITSWGSLGSAPGQLNQPKGLTLDQNNNVYVADEFNNRIQKFDSNGNLVAVFGQDRLNHPIDVAVDSQGGVYASDFDEILIYISIPPPDTDCTNPSNSNILITGTNGDDALIGTNGNNVINGLAGNDAMNGCSGNDQMSGGADNDVMAGSAGNDNMDGNAGDDNVQGGPGNDQMNGGADNDVMAGSAGNDNMDGNAGDDNVQGGPGNDVIGGNTGVNTLTGGQGNDVFLCGPNGDTITDFQPGPDTRSRNCVFGPAAAPAPAQSAAPNSPSPSTLISLPLP